MRKPRFTLIEMLVVVAIIAVVCSLLSPSLRRALNSAKGAACANNLRQCMMGLQMYADENRGLVRAPFTYDMAGGTSAVGWSYFLYNDGYLTTDRSLFLCPSQTYKKGWDNRRTYAMYALDKNLAEYKAQVTFPVEHRHTDNIAFYRLERLPQPGRFSLLSDCSRYPQSESAAREIPFGCGGVSYSHKGTIPSYAHNGDTGVLVWLAHNNLGNAACADGHVSAANVAQQLEFANGRGYAIGQGMRGMLSEDFAYLFFSK